MFGLPNKSIDIANKHIIAESGYDEFPYAVFFWEKSGKPYGISPTMKAVNDIKLYHAAMTDLLTVAEYSANPAKNVPEIMKGNENFQPGGFNYFVDPAHVASQLEVGTNFPITIQITQMLEQNIKEWYNVDFFLMLRANQTPINMTATEVAARQGEQAALLSSLVSNLFGGLNSVIQRTFNILGKKNLFPPLPFALQGPGKSLKVEFLGVLAQSQKAAYEYSGLDRVIYVASNFSQMGKIDPIWSRATQWLKPDVIFRRAIEATSAPMEIMRTREEYDKFVAGIDEKEEALAAQAAAAQQSQAVLQNAQNLNTRVAPGSMLENLLGKAAPAVPGSKR